MGFFEARKEADGSVTVTINGNSAQDFEGFFCGDIFNKNEDNSNYQQEGSLDTLDTNTKVADQIEAEEDDATFDETVEELLDVAYTLEGLLDELQSKTEYIRTQEWRLKAWNDLIDAIEKGLVTVTFNQN